MSVKELLEETKVAALVFETYREKTPKIELINNKLRGWASVFRVFKVVYTA